jgi:hypothetical protein
MDMGSGSTNGQVATTADSAALVEKTQKARKKAPRFWHCPLACFCSQMAFLLGRPQLASRFGKDGKPKVARRAKGDPAQPARADSVIAAKMK